jgi:CheY-like chemotaxis protein
MTNAAGALRILVVDDLRDAMEIMCMLLESLGHEVRGAVDGAQALCIADEFDPQLGILDIGLPGLSGYELARELRRKAGTKRLHLVALTGWGTSEDRARAFAAGFDQHFLKPADEQTLRKVVDTAQQTLRGQPVTVEVHPG